mmetsp:Transcript_12894/g.50424  ORF Transcript_12894/g.50424 Transcript_12894/m.50424 type:complete len:221 (-) Transcript_12894:838-1500(-)
METETGGPARGNPTRGPRRGRRPGVPPARPPGETAAATTTTASPVESCPALSSSPPAQDPTTTTTTTAGSRPTRPGRTRPGATRTGTRSTIPRRVSTTTPRMVTTPRMGRRRPRPDAILPLPPRRRPRPRHPNRPNRRPLSPTPPPNAVRNRSSASTANGPGRSGARGCATAWSARCPWGASERISRPCSPRPWRSKGGSPSTRRTGSSGRWWTSRGLAR